MTFNGKVKKAFSSQSTLMGEPEHCSLDPAQLLAAGLAVGRQVRVRRAPASVALYTISEDRPETDNSIVRMSKPARARLSASEEEAEFEVSVDTEVPRSTLTDQEARTQSEFVERLSDYGGQKGLLVLAPHGGSIEHDTDRQAERVGEILGADRATVWLCRGFKQGGGAWEQWHITSSDIDDVSFPLLGSIAHRSFEYAVAFHGFTEGDVLVGGGASRQLKKRIATAIQGALAGTDIQVRIARGSEEFDGNNPRNIVNRLTEGGIGGVQIEQSSEARKDYWKQIAEAVAGVFKSL